MANWVPFHEELCLGNKRGLSRATRFIFLELSREARNGKGVVKLAVGMTDVDAVHDLLGGSKREVAEALKALSAPLPGDDNPEPMIVIDGPERARTLRIPSWPRWSYTREPAGSSTARVTKHRSKTKQNQGVAPDETALHVVAEPNVTADETPCNASYRKEENSIPPSGGGRADAREPTPPVGPAVRESAAPAPQAAQAQRDTPMPVPAVPEPTLPPLRASNGQSDADLSPEERQVIESLRQRPAGLHPMSPPPLSRVAKPELARHLAAQAAPGGRVELDDVLLAIRQAADEEVGRTATDGPRNTDHLGALVRSYVRKVQRGEARRRGAAGVSAPQRTGASGAELTYEAQEAQRRRMGHREPPPPPGVSRPATDDAQTGGSRG